MIRYSQEKLVGRIDGFLFGISSLNGDIREYEGGAFMVELDSENAKVEKEINEIYLGQVEFKFDLIEKLDGGLREFEKRVTEILLPEFKVESNACKTKLGDYLAFRLSDMIEILFDQTPLYANITELKGEQDSNSYTFFGIEYDKKLLVLQFNKY